GNWVASLPRSASRRCHFQARATTSATASSRKAGHRRKRKQMRPCNSILGRIDRKRTCKTWTDWAADVGTTTVLMGTTSCAGNRPGPGRFGGKSRMPWRHAWAERTVVGAGDGDGMSLGPSFQWIRCAGAGSGGLGHVGRGDVASPIILTGKGAYL